MPSTHYILQVPELQMMRYLRCQEHFTRGHDGEATLVQAMFADFFVSEDVNTSTGIICSAQSAKHTLSSLRNVIVHP
jgi:hypothetical protein